MRSEPADSSASYASSASEAQIQADIRLAVGKHARHARLFRNNRGLFWAGKVIDRTETTVTLAFPRQVEAGLVNGASDLIGATQVTITPDMVGQTVAIFTAGEVKRPRVAVPSHQQQFVDFIREFGGFAEVIRSPADALRLVRAT